MAVLGILATYGLVNPGVAFAATLSDSEFQIEEDANLVVDAGPGSIDWLAGGSGSDTRSDVLVRHDRPTGQDDDAFTQGTNINDTPTTITTGSIPNNKSDLKSFGIQVDKQAAETFINVFWSRVQNPHGTTTMDFEFNQSSVAQNGISPPNNLDVNTHTIPLRTEGDILVTYFLEANGTHPTLSKRTWTSGVWGPSVPFSVNDALAGINTSDIDAAHSDGLGADALGPFDAFTFGEASMRLSAFVPDTGQCRTFGSVYLRSRSSATDTDENKDFIAPEPVTISNCGALKIHKTDSNGALAGAGFTIYKDVSPYGGSRDGNDTVVAGTCSTGANGECTVPDLKVGHYWVVETTVPAGHDAAPDTAAEVTTPDTTVTVPLVDPIQYGHIVVVKNAVPDDAQDFTFSLDGTTYTLDDDGDNANGRSSTTGSIQVPVGTHDLSETNIPSGWVNTSLVCDDNDSTTAKPDATVHVSKNETVTCTYTDTYTPTAPRLTTTASAAQGGGWLDTATLVGDGTHTVTGTVDFFVCGAQAAPTGCANGGTAVSSDVAVTNGSAQSASVSPTTAGWYCFRAEFTSESPYYTNATHTNDSTECFLKRNADLTVSKSAFGAFGRVYTWSIDKAVIGDSHVEVPAGTTHSFAYEVSVSNSHTDGRWTVTGEITVHNPNNVDFTGVDVTDAIDNGAGNCAVANGSNATVLAGQDLKLAYTCTYTDPPTSPQGTNTATATWDDAAFFTAGDSASGQAAVDFDEVTPSITNQFVSVSDTLAGDLGTLDGETADNPKVFSYSIEQTAPDGTCSTFPNTASVSAVAPVEEQLLLDAIVPAPLDTASASVDLCGGLPLGVEATGSGSFDRDYLWAIDKSVDQTLITSGNGRSATFNYTVKVTPSGVSDSGYALSGTVKVSNPNDWEDIVTDVTVDTDVGGGAVCAVTDGEDVSIPADGDVTLDYVCTFDSAPALTGTVTATATWDATEAATTDSSASSTQPVELALATETHKTITVTDDKTDPANPVELGTATYGDGEKSFTYSLTKEGVPGTVTGQGCADYTNIATIVETAQSDTQKVTLCHVFAGGSGNPEVNPPELPFTGDGIGLMAREAIALILGGLLLLVVNRKRRTA